MWFNSFKSDYFIFFRHDPTPTLTGWKDVSTILQNKFQVTGKRGSDELSVFHVRKKKEKEDLKIILGSNYIGLILGKNPRTSIRRTVSVKLPYSCIKKSGLTLSKTKGKSPVKYINKLHFDLKDPSKKHNCFEELARLILKNKNDKNIEEKKKILIINSVKFLKECIEEVIQMNQCKSGLNSFKRSNITQILESTDIS